MCPESQHSPARQGQGRIGVVVASSVPLNLRYPVISVVFWLTVMVGTAMPEAAVDEHGDARSREYKIGRASEVR